MVDHGVFVVAAETATVDDDTRRLVETLVATTEAAFDRLESEAILAEHQAELEDRNRHFRRQIQINEIIRTVDQSLVGASRREEIESAVCEPLVESEDVTFAWIGTAESGGAALECRAWAGSGEDDLDAVPLEGGGETPEPAVATARTESPTVVPNVVDRLQHEPWREAALARDFHSVVSVPLSVDEYVHGVLAVYADEPGTFGDLERSVFGELGETIANSITAVETRRALHADTLVELTLRFGAADAFLGRIARETDARVEYEGLGTHSDDGARLFFTTTGAPPDAVRTALEELVSVTDHRLIRESGAECLLEATVSGEVHPSPFVRHGASPRSMQATGTELEAIVDVPATTDVREFVGLLRDRYPDVELVGRRDVERATHTRGELVASLLDGLTDRQLDVLRTAYFAGFFEWPRESSSEEVAELLDVSQPTVNRHLRLAQGRLLEAMFDDGSPDGLVTRDAE
jgi:DNA-binding CsgD family transcriptional regulator